MKQGNQRIKGAVFERKVAKLLNSIWPQARRGIQYRDGGKEASDIIGTPYHIECSHGGESIWAKWEQAQKDAVKNPVVVKQRNGESPVVLLSLRDWIESEGSKYINDLEGLRALTLFLDKHL